MQVKGVSRVCSPLYVVVASRTRHVKLVASVRSVATRVVDLGVN